MVLALLWSFSNVCRCTRHFLTSSSFGAILITYYINVYASNFFQNNGFHQITHVFSSWYTIFRMLDLEWKFSCIMRSFNVFTSAASMPSFVHLIMPTAYLITGRMHIYGMDFPLSLLFNIYLIFHSLMILRYCSFPHLLIVVTMWLWNTKGTCS